MLRNRRLVRGLATFVFIAASACRGNAQDMSLQGRPWLVVVSGASDFKVLDDGSVKYLVSVPYPANEVIAQISNELQLRGWQPVDDDLAIQGEKNSHVTGWQTALDADGAFMYRCIADWVDQRMNGTTYR